MRSIILALALLLAAPAHAGDFEPTVYVTFTFGGAAHVPASPTAGARLDYRAEPGLPAAPLPVLRGELGAGAGRLELAGIPVVKRMSMVAAAGDGDDDSSAVEVIGWTGLVVAAVGAAGLVVMKEFGKAMADRMSEDMSNSWGGESAESAPPPDCSGVAIGDECVGH